MSTTTRKSLVKIKDSTHFYTHQIEGVRLMARMGSFILADEMGLGKSLQALTVAAIDFEKGWASRVLIICPASLKWNWANEIETHSNFTYTVLEGGPAARRDQLEEFSTDILIVNYEQVKPHLDELNDKQFDIAIFDESHYIKSPKSHRTKACLKLKVGRSFMLTGSPLLNNVHELWAPLHRIDPLRWPRWWTFVNRYCVYGGFKNKQIVGVKNQRELQDALDGVMIRRMKRDVLDLPDKQHVTVWVDLSKEQKALYDEAQDEMRITLPDNPDPMELENALTKFLRLKQICGTTATILGPDHDSSTKLDRAVEMIQEIVENGERVVVFTQFRGVLAAMEARLKKLDIPSWQLHGDVEASTRPAVVSEWGSAKAPGALLAMLQVAGVGLNMTQANKAIFLDKLFVPKLNEQAEDRLHRIGADKTQPVQVFSIQVRKTIESRVETILRKKTKLFDTMVNSSDWKRALYEALMEEEEVAA